MTRPFFIAFVCIGLLGFTTDTHASGDVLEVRAEFQTYQPSKQDPSQPPFAMMGPVRKHATFLITCKTDQDCVTKGRGVAYRGEDPQFVMYDCRILERVPRNLVVALVPAARTDLIAVGGPPPPMTTNPSPIIEGMVSRPPSPSGLDSSWDVEIRLSSGSLGVLKYSYGAKSLSFVQQSRRWFMQKSNAFNTAFKAVLNTVLKNVRSGCPRR
jgi:hypothetical protein